MRDHVRTGVAPSAGAWWRRGACTSLSEAPKRRGTAGPGGARQKQCQGKDGRGARGRFRGCRAARRYLIAKMGNPAKYAAAAAAATVHACEQRCERPRTYQQACEVEVHRHRHLQHHRVGRCGSTQHLPNPVHTHAWQPSQSVPRNRNQAYLTARARACIRGSRRACIFKRTVLGNGGTGWSTTEPTTLAADHVDSVFPAFVSMVARPHAHHRVHPSAVMHNGGGGVPGRRGRARTQGSPRARRHNPAHGVHLQFMRTGGSSAEDLRGESGGRARRGGGVD
jgi:hypothetical protein